MYDHIIVAVDGSECSMHAAEYGRPADEVVKYAYEHDVDLIVMGTRGIRGFKKLRLGSVSERVLKLAHCPVMVVK